MKLTIVGKQIFVDDALYTEYEYISGISESLAHLPDHIPEADIHSLRSTRLQDSIIQLLNMPVEELTALSEEELTEYALVIMRKIVENYRKMEAGEQITTEWTEGRDFGG